MSRETIPQDRTIDHDDDDIAERGFEPLREKIRGSISVQVCIHDVTETCAQVLRRDSDGSVFGVELAVDTYASCDFKLTVLTLEALQVVIEQLERLRNSWVETLVIGGDEHRKPGVTFTLTDPITGRSASFVQESDGGLKRTSPWAVVAGARGGPVVLPGAAGKP